MMPAARHPFRARLADPTVQLWQELRGAETPLALADLVLEVRRRAPLDVYTACRLVDAWLDAGHLVASGNPRRYQMVGEARSWFDPPAVRMRPSRRPHRTGDARRPHRAIAKAEPRQRLWTAMRILRRFDVVQLCLSSGVGESVARTFIRDMARSGYIEPTAFSGRVATEWACCKDRCGPKPPSITRLASEAGSFLRVVDRNGRGEQMVPVKPSPTRASLAEAPGGEVNHVC